MGIIFDDDVPIVIKFFAMLVWIIVGFSVAVFIYEFGIVEDLGDAICDETYGTDYIHRIGSWLNVGDIICDKLLVETEQYDGLIVKLRND